MLPAKATDGFAGLDAARVWVRGFMRWYDNKYRHGRIRHFTPAERHQGLDHQVFARRYELYERAKEQKAGTVVGSNA